MRWMRSLNVAVSSPISSFVGRSISRWLKSLVRSTRRAAAGKNIGRASERRIEHLARGVPDLKQEPRGLLHLQRLTAALNQCFVQRSWWQGSEDRIRLGF